MKPRHKASLLLFIAGVLFLIASPQYARICTQYPNAGSPTAFETVVGIPAVVFCVAGVAGIIAAVLLAVLPKPGYSS